MEALRHWAGGALRGQREGCGVEREQTAGQLGLQGHTGSSSASSDCPSIRKERGNPIWDSATSLTSQGQRARLPQNGPRPPPRAHSSSLARLLSLSLLFARSGPSPRPPLARPPPAAPPHSSVARARCSSARTTTAGCASARSRSASPDPTARIPLPGSSCLDRAARIPQSGPRSGTRLLGAFCPDPSLSLNRTGRTCLPGSFCLDPAARISLLGSQLRSHDARGTAARSGTRQDLSASGRLALGEPRGSSGGR